MGADEGLRHRPGFGVRQARACADSQRSGVRGADQLLLHEKQSAQIDADCYDRDQRHEKDGEQHQHCAAPVVAETAKRSRKRASHDVPPSTQYAGEHRPHVSPQANIQPACTDDTYPMRMIRPLSLCTVSHERL